MMKGLAWIGVAAICCAALACGGGEKAEAPAGEAKEAAGKPSESGEAKPEAADEGHEHGTVRHELGRTSAETWVITAQQADDVAAGGETVFYVVIEGPAAPTAVRLWVGDESATASVKALGEKIEAGRFHAHVEIPNPLAETDQFWVEVEGEGGAKGKAPFKLAAGAVLPPAGPHTGFVVPVSGPDGAAGFAELKLHDDKGDLEIWLATDAAITAPLDLPLDAAIGVTFPEKGKSAELRARNAEKNEDEDGNANVREGKTNYFIFPGATGADAEWLKGNFRSQATIQFSDGGKTYSSAPFTLVPHTHGPGGHSH